MRPPNARQGSTLACIVLAFALGDRPVVDSHVVDKPP